MLMAVRVIRAGGILLAVVLGVLLAGALPAAAHNELKSSNPAGGATLDTAPAAVVLTFAEALIQGKTTITVTGPDGANAAAGPAQLNGPTATVPLKPTAAGAYTVAYRVVADDGDVTNSNLKFTLTAAAVAPPVTTTTAPPTTTTTTTTTAPTTTTQAGTTAAAGTSSGTVWWPWVVGALVLILIVVLVLLLRRRRAGQAIP
jgi:hypothetical protein